MARADKSKAVAELAERFRSASGAVLTEYRGLSVADLRELRTALRGSADYVIVKNTLTKIAAKDAEVDGLDDYLVGPSAIAFITGDVVEASKGLKAFGKEHSALVVKGGVLDGAAVTAEQISKLAELESREVLLAKMAGAMKASMSNAAALFAAPLSKTARTVDALRAKVEEGSSAPETSADTTSTDAEAPAEAPQEG